MLAQTAPSAGQLVNLHTLEVAADVRVIAANRGAATQFRIAIAPGGEADENRHYLAFDKALAANESLSTKPLRLDAGTVVRVQSTSGNVSFTLNGLED